MIDVPLRLIIFSFLLRAGRLVCPSLRAIFSPTQPRAHRDALISQVSTARYDHHLIKLVCALREQEGLPAVPLYTPASFNTCPVYDRFAFAIPFSGPSATLLPPIASYRGIRLNVAAYETCCSAQSRTATTTARACSRSSGSVAIRSYRNSTAKGPKVWIPSHNGGLGRLF